MIRAPNANVPFVWVRTSRIGAVIQVKIEPIPPFSKCAILLVFVA